MTRWRRWFGRKQVERDLDDEIAFHLAMQEHLNREAGMEAQEANAAARRQFGGVQLIREHCRDHVFGWTDGAWQDLRYALRMFRRSPAFALFVVLTLSFGIGINVTAFSIIHAVLLESLPYAEPDRLVSLPQVGSVPLLEFYSGHARSFSGVGAWLEESMSLSGNGPAERVRASRVTATFFPVLGVEPVLGRVFVPQEDEPGGAKVALLSYSTWQNRFAADPRIAGRTIRLNAESVTVIGVLPPSFWIPGEPIEIWVPRVFDNRFVPLAMIRNGAGILDGAVARLKPGVTREQAEAELRVLDGAYHRVHPDHTSQPNRLEPFARTSSVAVQQNLLLLWGAAFAILLVTCANTAGLFLARATTRRKEMAVRLALGVDRVRLVRQLLLESVPFALCGGALGFLLARIGVGLVTAWGGHEITDWRQVGLDGAIPVFAAALSLITALVFGLAPALGALRSDPREAMQDSVRGESAGRGRVRRWMVVAQTAAAVALTLSCGMLLEGYVRLRTQKTGVRTEGVLTATLRVPDARYDTDALRVRFYDQLLRRLREIPGVTAAGAASKLTLQTVGEGSMTWTEGAVTENRQPPVVKNRSISPDYLDVLGIRVVAGRGFSTRDTIESPHVMLVNEGFARRFYPDGRVLGRRVIYSSLHVSAEIVGVVADSRASIADADPQPEWYVPYSQRSRHQMSLVVRSALAPAILEAEIRRAVREIDPDQPLYSVRTMDDVVAGGLRRSRSSVEFVGFLAAAALLLACIGIYAMLSFSVAQRRREIGIRMALGAQAGDVRWLVLREGLLLAGAGVALGIPAALAAARGASAVFRGLVLLDAPRIVAVGMLVLAVSMLGAWMPARRAGGFDPSRFL